MANKRPKHVWLVKTKITPADSHGVYLSAVSKADLLRLLRKSGLKPVQITPFKDWITYG